MQTNSKSTVFLILTSILLMSISATLFGQSKSNRFFSSGSEIVVDVLPGNDIYYSHRCDKGMTIYDLAEVFQISTEKLLRENKINPKSPNYDGKIVKIPISKSTLMTDYQPKSGEKVPVKIKYKVKKGDNLYRIAKEYFRIDPDKIVDINKKKSKEVQIGEELFIAWIMLNDLKSSQVKDKSTKEKTAIKHQPKPEKIKSETPKSEAKTDIDSKPKESQVKIVKFYLSDVIGYWDKTSVNNKNYFVLHNEARPGTMMDVYNPMLKRHIKAKVLGKMPPATYGDDIQIIISPAIAKDLGILDTRFKVNIKYEE